MKERLVEIDYLRGLAMFAMILIHTDAYFLNSGILVGLVKDWLEFAVPLFIFCSAYLFYSKTDSLHFFSHLKKRFTRLLKPYYLFVLILIIIVFFKEPQKLTFDWILQAVTFTGSIYINWLILLFLYLTILMPIIGYLYQKQKFWFYVFTLASFGSTLLFNLTQIQINYLWTMWLPWSTFLIFTLWLVKSKHKGRFLIISSLISGILFLLFLKLQPYVGHTLLLHENKYPPDFYFTAYGIFSTGILYGIAKTKITGRLIPGIHWLLNFLSRYSYPLFFVHYIVLYVISWTFNVIHFNWITFFVSVFTLSIASQYILNVLKKRIPLLSRL